MSLSIRPVIETWGPHVGFLSRGPFLIDALGCLAETVEDCKTETSDYGDVAVLWIENGAGFLDLLERSTAQDLMSLLANENFTSSDDEEYQRQVEDITGIRSMVPEWRKMIPEDGSLRLYCD